MHLYANPARFLRIARPLTAWLGWGGGAIVAAALAWGLFLAPPERLQGEAVRILYVHVPAAWLAMAGWTGIALASLMQLVWRHPLAAVAARAIAVPGLTFTGICLATGSLWGRPTWGTYWEWDGRMTSMLVLLFLYVGFIALAGAEKEKGGEGRITAIFGLVGAVNLPIIRYSVEWWESVHQKAEHQPDRGPLQHRRLDALAAARLRSRLQPAVRRDRADADARRPRAAQGRGAAEADGGRVSPWPFILAAYAVALSATLAVTAWSFAAMRRAEAEADALTGRP